MLGLGGGPDAGLPPSPGRTALPILALSVHWGRGKEEEAPFVGHQATVPWETDVQATS